MALYKFLAAVPGEKAREILIEADNEKESLEKLRRRGMTPVRCMGESSERKSRGFSSNMIHACNIS